MLLTPGRHDLGFRYRPGEPATGTLLVDGEVVGAAPIEQFVWSRFSITGAGPHRRLLGRASRPPTRTTTARSASTAPSSGPGSTSTASRSLDPDAEAEAAIARQ